MSKEKEFYQIRNGSHLERRKRWNRGNYNKHNEKRECKECWATWKVKEVGKAKVFTKYF